MINIFDDKIRIRDFSDNDFDLMYKWLTDLNVLEFYGGRDKNYTLDSIKEHYSKIYDFDMNRVIIEYENKPIGYGQFYKLNDELYQEYNYPNKGKVVYAMDQFIGEVEYWNKGIGSKYISLMCNYLKLMGANSILLDPHTDNIRAIKSYQKSGFKIIDELDKHEHFEGKDIDCYLMELCFDERFNIRHFKYLIEKYVNISINSIKYIGNGDDSVAYLINDNYIFKIKYNKLKEKAYLKEKDICDYINSNLDSNILIPNIIYFYSSDECEIIGYRIIDGNILNKELYDSMSEEEQELLRKDIALFLRKLHSLDYSSLINYKIDNKMRLLNMCNYITDNLELSDSEKNFINNYSDKVNNCCLFNKKVCLCHNDLSSKHMLINSDNRLCGIIDFGDSCVIDTYCDFIYLLEDSDEEIGSLFGRDILKLYGNIDVEETETYQGLLEESYPLELIYYGLNNNDEKYILAGKKMINNKDIL